MSKYSKGRILEYQVRDIFQIREYEVIRSAGSKGVWDIVAVKNGFTILSQIKSRRENDKNILALLLKPPLSSCLLRKVYIYKKGKELRGVICKENELVEDCLEVIIEMLENEAKNFQNFFPNPLTKKIFCGKIKLTPKNKKTKTEKTRKEKKSDKCKPNKSIKKVS